MLYGFRWIVLLSFYFCSLFSGKDCSVRKRLKPFFLFLFFVFLVCNFIISIENRSVNYLSDVFFNFVNFFFLFPDNLCFICLFKSFYQNCLIIRFGLQPAGSASSLALTENILPPCRLLLQRSRTPRQAKAEYRTGSTYFHSPPRPC